MLRFSPLLLWLAACHPLVIAEPAPGTDPLPVHPTDPTDSLPAGHLPSEVLYGPLLADFSQEPTLKIRVATHNVGVSIGRQGEEVTVIAPGTQGQVFLCPLGITQEGNGFRLTTRAGQWIWTSPKLKLQRPANQGYLTLNGTAYPGVLWIETNDRKLDAINELPLEDYLPGVLAGELYEKWELEAYKAQAVAARSYAVWEMTKSRSQHRPFDLEAGEASQAYAGSVNNLKAKQAVALTRGIVLAYNTRILPAFYSACSGGTSQDAAAAFPGRVADLPPLRGRTLGKEGEACKLFQWGPLVRDAADAGRRIAGWGQRNRHPVAALRDIRSIAVTQRATTGRPMTFTLTNAAGRTFALAAEDFRLALNDGLPTLPREQKLPSSFCDIRLDGKRIIAENGHGFGHGVGLDQWGAQGLAMQGQNAAAILGWYYPGATPVRAW